MKTRKILSASMMVVIALMLCSPSFAWGGRPPKPDRGYMVDHIAKKLKLTDEQKAIFKTNSEKLQREMKAQQEEVKKIAGKLKAELKKDIPDRKSVEAFIRQMSNLRAEMQIKRTESLLDMRKMLTPKQKEKFKNMLPEGKRDFDKKTKNMGPEGKHKFGRERGRK